jgi:hypothetical protein
MDDQDLKSHFDPSVGVKHQGSTGHVGSLNLKIQQLSHVIQSPIISFMQ